MKNISGSVALLLVGESVDMLAAEVVKLGQGNEILTLTSDRATLSIKEIREFLGSTRITTWQGTRLAVIPAAHRLSLPAANALLKSLEEPPAHTKFILTTHLPGQLLPTIRSRCQRVRVSSQHIGSTVVNPFNLKELIMRVRGKPLSEPELAGITKLLQDSLYQPGPNSQLTRAYLRLRDYYKIKSLKGNEKLATDILLASLHSLAHTKG